MHWDHVGAANLFTDSTLLIQDAEYQAAFVDQNNQLFDPSLYLDLADSERRILNGDYDVFGDGSVMIISAPGHTPGHQVLLVELENTGPVLLSGDLYHFRKSRELRRVPLFNTDAEETLRSMDKIEALLKAEQATLWIEHDQALADTLKKAPEYYD
jgi:glyoxylase-like metal-dependent hydrolase (beta-lactamase superfamily II)